MAHDASNILEPFEGVLSSSKRKVSVLIADDHLLLAETVAESLKAAPRYYDTALASNLSEVLHALASGMIFDIVLLDVRMPGMFGLKSIVEVVKAAAPAKVCLFSGGVDRTLVHLAVENGACGFIPKTISVKSLASVVELVLSGQIFIPAQEQRAHENNELGENNQLNERELCIIRLTAEGLINKEIASYIGTSEMTIKMHMRLICSKLNARNRVHAVTLSREYGLL